MSLERAESEPEQISGLVTRDCTNWMYTSMEHYYIGVYGELGNVEHAAYEGVENGGTRGI